MNNFLKQSIEIANNYDYLDRLFNIYSISTNIRRNIDSNLLSELEKIYNLKDNVSLIKKSLELDLFPIKDSYVAFLKRYPKSIDKNPQTINRLAGAIYDIGWDKFLLNITEPKETNRQMGSKFREWLNKKPLGLMPVDEKTFLSNN